MLEIRNVTKIYRTKAGNEVKALDNVSVTFPERGMVFILGKSGSGKSTLLNIIGGLDGADSGEFIIKGKSSETFGGSDFDAYRNTFIGFIFQEYNVLDDFTVGANIGLALELQGKKATSDKIGAILQQVDLTDYANRKPNELSGGQKQRVAIARALVKDPEIIMADEPTGALDSNTGKQIFDTLKKLSENKLVIIVSHDRDFAEKYGDRIIEMKDGHIESDVTRHSVAAVSLSDGIVSMSDNLIKINKGYQLTPRDVEMINKYLASSQTDTILSTDKRINETVRVTAGIAADNSSSVFDKTDAQKDIKVKEYDQSKTKFIRSKLPLKNALKIGGGGLGHKKFRLVMTIFLSLIAFGLFGFADTMAAYNKYTAATNSVIDSNIQNASFSLNVKRTYTYSDGSSWSYYTSDAMNDEDISNLSKKIGINFFPVFNGSSSTGQKISIRDMMINASTTSAFDANLYGFAAIENIDFQSLGYSVYGTLPQNKGEIAITEFVYRQFKEFGFKNQTVTPAENVSADDLTVNEGSNSIIGKHLTMYVGSQQETFLITAVVDTGFDYDRYSAFLPSDTQKPGNTGSGITDMFLEMELANTLSYGFHSLGYVVQQDLDAMSENMYGTYETVGTRLNFSASFVKDNPEYPDQPNYVAGLSSVAGSSSIPDLRNVVWFDGRTNPQLGENEVLVSNLFANKGEALQFDASEYWYSALSAYFTESWSDDLRDYDQSSVWNRLIYYRYFSQNFDTEKDNILRYYFEDNGIEFTGTDDELRTWLKDYIIVREYYPWVEQTKLDAVIAESEKGVLQKLLKTEFETEYPREFYTNILNFVRERMQYFTTDDAFDIAVRIYCYDEVLTKGAALYDTDKFFSEVISQNYPFSQDEWSAMPAESKVSVAAEAYYNYMRWNSQKTNPFGDKTPEDLKSDGNAILATAFDFSAEKWYIDYYSDAYIRVQSWDNLDNEQVNDYKEYKIVGTFDTAESGVIISDKFSALHDEYCAANGYGKEEAYPHKSGIYAFAIAVMPSDRDMISKMVELSYDQTGGITYTFQNQVMNSLDGFNEFIEMGAKIFLYIGLGFALFAALMLMNFISTSISYKRHEIGVLRAVGARSSDVFKIFFCEALIIALINYVLALAATIAGVSLFNGIVRNQGIKITLLNFGIRQVALMLVISVFVALVASFLPVWNIARRKPIDAIRNK